MFEYHPINVYPVLDGATGAETEVPTVCVTFATVLPPFSSNEMVAVLGAAVVVVVVVVLPDVVVVVEPDDVVGLGVF